MGWFLNKKASVHHWWHLYLKICVLKSLLLNLRAGISFSVVFAQSVKICSSKKKKKPWLTRESWFGFFVFLFSCFIWWAFPLWVTFYSPLPVYLRLCFPISFCKFICLCPYVSPASPAFSVRLPVLPSALLPALPLLHWSVLCFSSSVTCCMSQKCNNK